MLSRSVLNAHSARLRSIFYIVFILFFFSGRHLWGNLPVLAAPAERPLASPVPGVTIGAPSNPFIGSALTLTLTFDNTSATDTGYGPYIDLFLPLSGADGQNPPPQDDGISFVSANYLGASVTTQVLNCPAGGNVTHPLTGQAITCPAQPPGLYSPFVWQLVVITLPFGSFVPDQPPASVAVNAQLSTYADVGVALPIQARGGFMFGADPLDNPNTDPPIQGSMTSTNVTPSLFTLEKTYLGPEDETATGPNFPRRYTVTATIAPGQTMTSFTLTDVLPNNMQFVSVVSTTPSGATCTTPSTTIPGGTLSCAFSGSVSGTVSMTFEYYIPLRDSGGASVIDPASGDDALSCNNASASGYWDAADPRDTDQPVSQDAAGCEHTLTDKSIAIQKSVNVVGGGIPKPGAILEYALEFQISDFFAFNGVVVTDTISDGQHFDPSFAPTLQINGNTYTLTPAPFNIANYDVTCNYSGGPGPECTANDPAANDGTTTLTFRVSDEIISRGQDGRLIGGCVPTTGTGGSDPSCSSYNDGPTTGRIVFRTIIQENFTDTYPSGDASVDQGDVLNNTVRIAGNVLSTSDASTPTGNSEEDESAASVSIPYGTISKSIYAINGNSSFATPVHVKPGDTVTYRITYTLPTSDFEDLVITDYLPLPVFSATEVTSFSNAVCGIPNAGQSCLGPSDSYHSLSGAVNPAFSTNAAGNWVRWTYGDYDAPNNPPSTIDLLFTVTVRNDPFADGLYLTNQAFAQEGSTNSSGSEATGIIQITLDEPALRISKGVVWTDNPNGGFTPSPVGPVTFSLGCPAFSGTITSSGLAANPVNSNLNNVDAADQVMMAIIIENTGHASAFDVRVRDSLPAGMTYVSGSLCVTDGTGAPISYTDLGGGLFGSGIELDDPGPTPNPPGALDPGKDSNGNTIDNGGNIAVITYLVTLDISVQGGQILTNTATLFNYAGSEGGPDHTANDLTDVAQTQIRYDGLGKTFTTEIIDSHNSQTQVVIGEYIDYTITITFHEGVSPNVTLQEQLPAGLAFVDCISITPSSTDLTTNLSGGFSAACNDPTNPNVSSPGQNFTFTLGTITNSNTDNSVDETLTIVFRAVTLNVLGNQSGTNLVNRATLVIDGGAGGTATVQSAPATVIEPVVNTTKSVSPTSADAGDTVTFTVTLSNPASGSTTAYEVTWSDVIPNGLNYVSAAGACGATSLSFNYDSGTRTLSLASPIAQLDPGQSCTITINVTVDYSVSPGQTITNTAQTRWTSIPGARTDVSPYNLASDERTGEDGLLNSGALNDYRTEGTAVLTINSIAPQKSLAATSEAHTGVVSGLERVTIGEIVRYRLVVQLPEGTSPNFQIRDYLETGLTYLDDGTAKVAFVSNGGGITSSDYGTLPVPGITDPDCFLTGNFADATTPAIPSSCAPLADENVGSDNSTSVDNDNYSSGTYPSFKLGTLTNNDNDSDAEYVILEFNVLVDNTLSGNNDAGEYRVNGFGVWIDDVKNGEDANWVRVDIVEPALSLTKVVTAAPVDAGDPITYTLTISAASGVNRSTAFDLTLTDTLDPYFVIGSVNIAPSSWTCVGNGGVSIPFSGNYSWGGSPTVVTVTANCLDPGQSITVTISGTVAANAPAGYTIPNTANLTWTSLPGTGTSPNPTGSTTPGGSGADNGERDGSGGINDYTASANANAPLSTPQIVKGAPTPTSYTIGATVTYPITITLPEGVTRNVRVTDAVPTGMQYVSYSLDTSAFGGTVPAPTVTGGASNGDDVTFTFGDITTTDDNNSANNSFILYVNLSVLNVSTNYDGVILPNSASLTYWPGTGTTDTTIPGGTQNITVIEPQITTTKSVNPTGGVQAGDTITYTVRFTNTGNSTAYDVTAEDTLAQGVTYNVGSASCVFFNGSTTSSIGVTVTVGAGTLTFDGNPPGSWDIPATNPDSYIECTYTATAQSSLYLDGAHTNTIDADWSSLNGSDPEERLYNDSGTSPLDGTQDTASATFNSPAPTFDKSDNATGLPIGAAYTVTLTLTSPLGTLRNLTITDTLPTGLFYVTGSQNVSSGISPAPTFAVTGPNDGSAPTTLTWAFGDAVVSASPITITYNVMVANVSGNQNGTTRTNTATLSYDDAGGSPRSQTDTDSVTIIEPELDIAKSVDDATPAYGQTLTYTLTVSHLPTSTATAYDIVVTDTIPSGLTYVSGSISAPAGWTANDASAPTLTWTCSAPCSLPVGNTAALTYQVTVASTPPPNIGDTLTNTASMTWTSTDGTNPDERTGSGGINDYNDTSTQEIILTNPDLRITKTDGQTSYVPGSPVVYTIVVSNVGNGDAIGATVSDAIPPQITFWSWLCTAQSGGATGCDPYSGSGNFSDTVNLPAGSSITYTVTAQTDPAATTDLTNTVTVTPPAGFTDPTPGDNTASDTDTPNPQADLSVTKDDGVTMYIPGGTLTYTIVVSNAGPSNAPGSLVTDNIPAQFTSWSWICTAQSGGATGCDSYSGSGNFSDTVDLPAGSSITYTVTAQVASSATGNLTNTVTVTPPTGVTDPTPGNNTASDTDIQNSQAAISVTKDDGVTEYIPGGTLTYFITVTNTGPSDALGVSVSDNIPPQFTSWMWSCFSISGGASGCTPYSGNGDFTDTIDLAGPFPSSITYQVVAQVRSSATGLLTNTVTVSHPADTTPDDNTASDTDTPNYQADLYVTKDDGSATYTPGVGVTYTVTIGNNGPSDVSGAVLTDNLPAQATSWTWTCSGSTGGASGCDDYGPGNANFSDTVNLPAGSTITYTVAVVIPSSATGDLVNTASIEPPSGVTDTNTANNSATDTDTQNSQAAISVTKDDGVTQYIPGTSLTYTITVTNTGPSDALGVSVTDNIPSQFTSWTWTCSGSTGGASGCTGSGGPIATDFTDSIDLAGPFPSSITYTVTAQVASSATGDLTNTVTVSHPADTDPGDNTASDTDTPNPQADLSVTKDDGVTVVSPDSTITYTITVSNAGPSDAIGATVSDLKPAQIDTWTWVCFGSTGGATDCDGVTNSTSDFTDVVNLPAGSSITYQVTAHVAAGASGTLTNSITITPPSGVDDTDPTNNTDEDVDTIITTPAGDLTKSLIATNQGFTSGSSVAIGEIVTYEVTFTVPAGGTMPNLTLTDVLDRGLAFVDCVSITPSSTDITTTLLGGFAAACNDPTNPTIATEPAGSPNPADPGRRVTFSLGDVSNSGASNGTVSIRYTAVVLDTIENQDGVSLNNEATLTWSSGSLTTSAPNVTIVEPDFELIKEADRTVAMPGSIITFTLTFRHTNLSNVDAFDVVLTDVLPPGLTYVPGSLTIVSGPPGGVTDDTAAPTLRVRWDTFPLLTGGSRTEAVVRFQAVLGNLLPGQKVRNTASLEWTSLPGDVSTPQSPYNDTSTERYYDPLSPVNVYGTLASVVITVPLLPATGFAPGRLTSIPVQPPEKAYQDLGDLWLEIPKLGLKMPIVGVPAKGEEWDLTWLWDQAGWLEGTAYPTHAGNSALTAHVYLPNGEPGPFFNLGNLVWGDQIIVHLGGQAYIYEVRQVRQISPNSLSALRHEELPWLTLITCREYDARTNSYRYRVVVRAVLIKIVGE